jgi:uncharacterized membrane protein
MPSGRRDWSQSAGAVLCGAGVLALLALASCGSGSRSLLEVDPEAAPLHPTYEEVVGILDRKCVPCHRGGGGLALGLSATDRAGLATPSSTAEDGGDYSTCQGIEAGLGGLLSQGVERETMPPGALPRLTEREKLIIVRWIDQGACSPCQLCR